MLNDRTDTMPMRAAQIVGGIARQAIGKAAEDAPERPPQSGGAADGQREAGRRIGLNTAASS